MVALGRRVMAALCFVVMSLGLGPEWAAAQPAAPASPSAENVRSGEAFDRDRQAILAMAGNFNVTFDFTETVAFAADYALKEPKLTGGHEVVRVIEDRGDFISLQHLLVVGPDDAPIVVKHWRQDWRYEPARVLVFLGGNAWGWREVARDSRAGAWSQTVYQVDDAPRYGGVGRWSHLQGISQWEPGREWRPLPRRDATTRNDYHAIDAVNRHVITANGWVHEQDNTKLRLAGEPTALVREIGVNTYRRFEAFPIAAAEQYWAATKDYWAAVRAEWSKIENDNPHFAIRLVGEPEALYIPLLEIAGEIEAGRLAQELAMQRARAVMAQYLTTEVGALAGRLQ